jgi:hypothetical protein
MSGLRGMAIPPTELRRPVVGDAGVSTLQAVTLGAGFRLAVPADLGVGGWHSVSGASTPPAVREAFLGASRRSSVSGRYAPGSFTVFGSRSGWSGHPDHSSVSTLVDSAGS